MASEESRFYYLRLMAKPPREGEDNITRPKFVQWGGARRFSTSIEEDPDLEVSPTLASSSTQHDAHVSDTGDRILWPIFQLIRRWGFPEPSDEDSSDDRASLRRLPQGRASLHRRHRRRAQRQARRQQKKRLREMLEVWEAGPYTRGGGMP